MEGATPLQQLVEEANGEKIIEKEVEEPPLKKQKLEEKPPIEKVEIIPENRVIQAVKTEIKSLLIMNPTLSLQDFIGGNVGDIYLDDKSLSELTHILENIKIHLGISEPYSNAKMALCVVSTQISKKFGFEGLTEELIDDTTLLSLIEQYIPSSHWLSPPLHILYRIYGNIEKWRLKQEQRQFFYQQDMQNQYKENQTHDVIVIPENK